MPPSCAASQAVGSRREAQPHCHSRKEEAQAGCVTAPIETSEATAAKILCHSRVASLRRVSECVLPLVGLSAQVCTVLEQYLHNVEMPVRRRSEQRREAWTITVIRVCAFGEQPRDNLLVAARDGSRQSVVACTVRRGRVQIRAPFQQIFRDASLAEKCGESDYRKSIRRIALRQCGFRIHELLHALKLTCGSGFVQFERYAPRKQQVTNFAPAVIDREQHRRLPLLIPRTRQRRLRVQQRLHRGGIAILDCREELLCFFHEGPLLCLATPFREGGYPNPVRAASRILFF